MILFFLFPMLAQAYEVTQLQGYWKGPCHHGVQKTEFFVGSDVTYTETYFRDSLCTKPGLEMSGKGDIEIGEFVSIPAGAQEMDFRFESTAILLLDPAYVISFNKNEMCGIRNWELNLQVDATGLNCDFFGMGKPFPLPHRDEMRFGIFQIREDQLFFGKLNSARSGLDPDHRPLEWDLPFIRIRSDK